MQNYKVSTKRKDTGKWWSFGNIKTNKFGNPSLGMRVTPELKALINGAEEGSWLNFSLFEDDKDNKAPNRQQQPYDNYQAPLDDGGDIPF